MLCFWCGSVGGGGWGGGYARIYADKMETLSGLENFRHLDFDIFRVQLP